MKTWSGNVIRYPISGLARQLKSNQRQGNKCKFKNKNGLILLDQVRAVDKSRLVKKLGSIDEKIQ